MIIEKYKKRANGIYTLYFNDFTTIDLYEEIILEYELLIVKELTKETLEKIKTTNENYSSYYEALKILNKSLKTTKEIIEYLKRKEYSEKSINFAITKLKSQAYLNDKNYAKSYVHHNIITTSKGPNKIIKELIDKGLTNEDYLEAVNEYNKEIEKEKINKLIVKKINSNHNKSAFNLRQKIMQDLINNGFNKDNIKEVLNNIEIKTDEKIVEKEYKKYYQKLSKKYSGKELDYHLKQKMHSLGFEYNKKQ